MGTKTWLHDGSLKKWEELGGRQRTTDCELVAGGEALGSDQDVHVTRVKDLSGCCACQQMNRFAELSLSHDIKAGHFYAHPSRISRTTLH